MPGSRARRQGTPGLHGAFRLRRLVGQQEHDAPRRRRSRGRSPPAPRSSTGAGARRRARTDGVTPAPAVRSAGRSRRGTRCVGRARSRAAVAAFGSARSAIPHSPQKLWRGVGRWQFAQTTSGPMSISSASSSSPRWIARRSRTTAIAASTATQMRPGVRSSTSSPAGAATRNDRREQQRQRRRPERSEMVAIADRRAEAEPERARPRHRRPRPR